MKNGNDQSFEFSLIFFVTKQEAIDGRWLWETVLHGVQYCTAFAVLSVSGTVELGGWNDWIALAFYLNDSYVLH